MSARMGSYARPSFPHHNNRYQQPGIPQDAPHKIGAKRDAYGNLGPGAPAAVVTPGVQGAGAGLTPQELWDSYFSPRASEETGSVQPVDVLPHGPGGPRVPEKQFAQKAGATRPGPNGTPMSPQGGVANPQAQTVAFHPGTKPGQYSPQQEQPAAPARDIAPAPIAGAPRWSPTGMEVQDKATGKWVKTTGGSAAQNLEGRFPGWSQMTPDQRRETLAANPAQQPVGKVIPEAPQPTGFDANDTYWKSQGSWVNNGDGTMSLVGQKAGQGGGNTKMTMPIPADQAGGRGATPDQVRAQVAQDPNGFHEFETPYGTISVGLKGGPKGQAPAAPSSNTPGAQPQKPAQPNQPGAPPEIEPPVNTLPPRPAQPQKTPGASLPPNLTQSSPAPAPLGSVASQLVPPGLVPAAQATRDVGGAVISQAGQAAGGAVVSGANAAQRYAIPPFLSRLGDAIGGAVANFRPPEAPAGVPDPDAQPQPTVDAGKAAADKQRLRGQIASQQTSQQLGAGPDASLAPTQPPTLQNQQPSQMNLAGAQAPAMGDEDEDSMPSWLRKMQSTASGLGRADTRQLAQSTF